MKERNRKKLKTWIWLTCECLMVSSFPGNPSYRSNQILYMKKKSSGWQQGKWEAEREREMRSGEFGFEQKVKNRIIQQTNFEFGVVWVEAKKKRWFFCRVSCLHFTFTLADSSEQRWCHVSVNRFWRLTCSPLALASKIRFTSILGESALNLEVSMGRIGPGRSRLVSQNICSRFHPLI